MNTKLMNTKDGLVVIICILLIGVLGTIAFTKTKPSEEQRERIHEYSDERAIEYINNVVYVKARNVNHMCFAVSTFGAGHTDSYSATQVDCQLIPDSLLLK